MRVQRARPWCRYGRHRLGLGLAGPQRIPIPLPDGGRHRLSARNSRSGYHPIEKGRGLTSKMEEGSRPHLLHIGADEAGSRLDRMLLRRLGRGTRPLILRFIRKGNVRVNGKRAKPETRLEEGDMVFVPLSLRQPPAGREHAIPRLGPLERLYEDEHFIVINKPQGIVVHAGSGHVGGIIDVLRQETGLADLRLAHRLDRDTSGCLLLAKSLPALRILAEDFRRRRMDKTYLAWVKGHPEIPAARLSGRLAKGVLRGGERMVMQHTAGRQAQTDYRAVLLAVHDGWPFALLALMPESGRTHQLRVQLQAAGHAILGDGKYGERADVRRFRDMGGKGLALHAWRLRFVHPMTQDMIDVRAPWPAWWSACFGGIRHFLI